jgi:phenylpropionate dioxygenase-like ring-hydroxylating dioxygenase large terminal subunit
MMWHELNSKQFGYTLTVVYATPIRKGECRLFARFPFRFSSKVPALAISLMPRWYSHMGQNAILEDDQIFLHYQERYLTQAGGGEPIAKAFYLPTKADRFVFELRQWANLFAADPFPGQVLPPVQGRSQLLERYHSHTQHCASCRNALRRMNQIQLGLAAIAVVSLAIAPILAAIGVGLAGAIANAGVAIGSGVGWVGLNQLKRRLVEGRSVPARNL